MEQSWLSSSSVLAFAQIAAAFVTAWATVRLWKVTNVLAIETKRMAEASQAPHVTATIEPNRWSLHHFDLHVVNSGAAPAYQIKLEFTPPLPQDPDLRKTAPLPFQSISVLRPGQSVMGYVADFGSLEGQAFEVKISWTRTGSIEREEIKYEIDMKDREGHSQLGSSEPLTQIAEQMKKLREDWQDVASGKRPTASDVFTSEDRRKKKEERQRWIEEQRAKSVSGD